MNRLSAARASDAFGLTLMQALAQDRRGQNLFVSPLSVFLALAMAANGAAPETRTALLTGMNLPDDLQASNAACRELLQGLMEPETDVEMELANALWAFAPHRFEPTVQARIKEAFGAELRDVEWRSAAAEINQWAAENTHQMIRDAVANSDFNSKTAFALSNATYFKGVWTSPFEPSDTRPMPFHRRNGTKRTVPMMQATRYMKIAETPEFQAIQLPYGSKRFYLYAFLPAQNRTPESLLPQLSLFEDAWRKSFRAALTELSFPRFTLDLPSINLMPTLEKLSARGKSGCLSRLGLRLPPPERSLLGGNDFSPLAADVEGASLTIDKVAHKTKLEIDETGTRAAAVTVAVPRFISKRIANSQINFDRPFALCLADEKTQTTLFMGIVHDPT